MLVTLLREPQLVGYNAELQSRGGVILTRVPSMHLYLY